MKQIPVYQIDDFEHSETSFYANLLSLHIHDHGFINKAHKHDFYVAVLFTQGTGTHEIDFTAYPVAPGALFFLAPGQMHRWELTSDVEGYIFFHSAEFYHVDYTRLRLNNFPFFSVTEPRPAVFLPKQETAFTSSLFQKIVNEYRVEYTPGKRPLIAALVNLIYQEIAGRLEQYTFGTQKSPGYLQKTNELIRLIDQHYLTLKYPKDYAALTNISIKHLNRVSKETLGKTTGELVAERVMLEAKRLLAQQGKTVNEVAWALGFEDPSYFIRFFKKQQGESPAVFQRKHR